MLGLYGGAALALIGYSGLSALLRVKFRVNRFCAPFAAACLILTVTSLLGMLGLLKPAALFLCALGIFGLCYAYIIKKQKPDFAMLALTALIIAFVISQFYDYTLFKDDDYNHWGIVSRLLYETDALPDDSSLIMFFSSYPPGTAALIYYFAVYIGYSEPLAIIVQEIFMYTALMCVLSCVSRNKSIAFPLLGIACLYLLGQMTEVRTLQVDVLLGFMFIAVIAVIYRAADGEEVAFAERILPLCAFALIKTAGLFFAVMGTLAYVSLTHRAKKQPVRALACLIAPAAMFGVWSLYAHKAFPVLTTSYHPVSIDSFTQNLSANTADFPLEVFKKLIDKHIHPTFDNYFICACFAVLVLAAVLALTRGQRRKQLLLQFANGVLLYILWQITLYFTYIFSMVTEEALELASYSRYNRSVLVPLLVMNTFILINALAEQPLFQKRGIKLGFASAGAIICVALIACGAFTDSWLMRSLFTKDNNSFPLHDRIENAYTENSDLEASDVLIFIPEGETAARESISNSSVKLFKMLKYFFYTPEGCAVIERNAEYNIYRRCAVYNENGALVESIESMRGVLPLEDALSDSDYKAIIVLGTETDSPDLLLEYCSTHPECRVIYA